MKFYCAAKIQNKATENTDFQPMNFFLRKWFVD